MRSHDLFSPRVNRALRISCLGVIAVACAIGVIAPWGFHWDFANFYDAGAKVLAGQAADLYDPDVAIDGQTPHGKMTFMSVPLSSYLYVPIAALDAWTAFRVFKIENVLAMAAALLILFRQARACSGSRDEDRRAFATVFVLAVLVYQPFWTMFAVGGQTTPTVMLLLSLGLWLHVRDRLTGSSLCFVLATVIKPVLAPGLAFLALASGRRVLVPSIAFGVGLAGISLMTLGWEVHARFLDAVFLHGPEREMWAYSGSVSTWIDAIGRGSGVQHGMQPIPFEYSLAGLCFRLGAAAVLVRLTWLAHRRTGESAVHRHWTFCSAVLLALVLAPVVWEHYFSFVFIPLSFLLAVRRTLPRSAQLVMVMVIVASMAQNVVLMDWLQRTVGNTTTSVHVSLSLLKGAPLLLMLWLCWSTFDRLVDAYRRGA